MSLVKQPNHSPITHFPLPIKLLVINHQSSSKHPEVNNSRPLINQILSSISSIARFTHLGGARDSFWADYLVVIILLC
ncbi:hypothetical protein PGTUg99_021769 [Puccinia graminis f. sp. tritici]|uniref:Uncharacterized protein n=1 Tax=Puccinia graminis f. sp. tritici TaxID=56615 RepID=A0A5B0SDJ3_PUCGR|nr:hypothetical protein PGTUg99_021769 [Puccinia graminis f. sp. tritici]